MQLCSTLSQEKTDELLTDLQEAGSSSFAENLTLYSRQMG